MKRNSLLVVSLLILIINSCASPVKCSFFCEEPAYQIVVDDETLGSGLVSFSAPKGVQYVNVKVMDNGKLVYENKYYVGNFHKNELITINIPKNYRY